MKRVLPGVLMLALTPFVLAADPPSLSVSTAQGTVEKIEKDSLSVKPRQPDGKFGKTIVLKLTDTSKVWRLEPRESAGKTIVTQRSIEARDLRAGQSATVVYTTLKEGNVLMQAVVLPAPDK